MARDRILHQERVLAAVVLGALIAPGAWAARAGKMADSTPLIRPDAPVKISPARPAEPPLSEINQHLSKAPYQNAQREELLLHWFEDEGCTANRLKEEPVTPGQPPNVICTLRGQSDSVIVVAGHTDHVKKGMGVLDDWSGASLLPSLYAALRSRPGRHTFVFIGFSEEERGLVGSKCFVRELTADKRRRIRAMINLECLGLTATKVWSDHADPRLLRGLLYMASRLHLQVAGIDLEDVGRDDAESFRKTGIATITFHSLTRRTIHIMHSPQDQLSAINLADYDQSYRLIAAYLAYLDQILP